MFPPVIASSKDVKRGLSPFRVGGVCQLIFIIVLCGQRTTVLFEVIFFYETSTGHLQRNHVGSYGSIFNGVLVVFHVGISYALVMIQTGNV